MPTLKDLAELKLEWGYVLAGQPTGKYLALARSVDPGFAERLASYPNVAHLAKAQELESATDFSAANDERKRALDLVTHEAPRRVLEGLVLASRDFKMGKQDAAEYHAYLWGLVEDLQLDDGSFENLRLYAEYAKHVSALDESALPDELAEFSEEMIQSVESLVS